MLLLTADVEKIAELASAADGLYGMTRSCYGSGWFSPSSSQNRNFAIVAKKPKWNRVTNCRWTLGYDKIMLISPGGKRSMNLIFLLSTNSQNRNL